MTILGTASNDTLDGGSADDTLSGLGGDDSLNGEGGNDTLYGDAADPSSSLYSRLGIRNFGLLEGNDPAHGFQDYTKSNLTAAAHDMLIIDMAQSIDTTKVHGESLWSASDIHDIETSGSKLLIGYMSIAKINTYRDNWDSSWVDSHGNPTVSWLSAKDTSGESQNGYLGNLSDPAWKQILFDRIDAMIAQGFNGVFLDDMLEYYNQTPDPSNSANWPKLAANAKAMRDLVVALKAHVNDKLGAGNHFAFIINGAPDIIDHADISGSVDTAQDAAYYASVDAFLAESYFGGGDAWGQLSAQKHFGDRGIPLLAVERGALTEDQRQMLMADAAAHGFVPYASENGSYIQHLFDPYVAAGAGNDFLDGGAGADVMIGGGGNDIYVVDAIGDVVTENPGEGIDGVQSAISYTLGANVENLSLIGSQALNGTGNELNNRLVGNTGKNILTGGLGNDTLDGGAGADTMIGGTGNDTYYVDNSGDVVTELAGGGVDTVITAQTYVLGSNVEKLTLTGTGNMGGTGNSLANVLIGNAGNNHLSGLAGNDTLSGGLGNDVLDGGKGADTLKGGAGDDRYYVENTGDIITEYANQGHDTVVTTLNYALGANVEDLIQVGTHDYYASGNALDNHLTGNIGNNLFHGGDGNDIIDGGKGADKMYGGFGNDTFYVDNVDDVIVEYSNQGTDSVFSTITYTLGGALENLTLLGTTNINGTGTSGDNILIGNSGDNVITGGKGHDVLTGGLGADTFVFAATSGVDTITDFSAGQGDVINVSAYTHGTVHGAYLSQSGSDTTIDLGDGNIITILNTMATDTALLSHIVW